MLKNRIEDEIKNAMKTKNVVAKDVLRVVLGEIQTQESRTGKNATDEDVIRTIRKVVEGIKEVSAVHPTPTSATELQILETYLPQQADATTIKAFVENNVDLLVAVKGAKSDGQATGVLMKALKEASVAANGKDVGDVVKGLRA